jgi:hypothetical protein
MVGAIKTVCSNLRWKEKLGRGAEFQRRSAAPKSARCAGTTRMSMGHIVDKVWKHKMLRLGGEPIDPAAPK